MFYQKFGFKIFTHYARLRYRLFRYNPSYRILACLKHILQKRVADLNEILHRCNLLPREISSKSFEYFQIPFAIPYFIRIISSLSRENYFSISEKYYKPNLVDIIFRFEKLSLKIFYFGNSLAKCLFFFFENLAKYSQNYQRLSQRKIVVDGAQSLKLYAVMASCIVDDS